MMLMIVEPGTLIDILATDECSFCHARIGDPSLHLAWMTSWRRAPIDIASDMGEDKLGSEQLVVELGILPVMVLESHKALGIFENIASGFDETLRVEVHCLELVFSWEARTGKWNAWVAVLSQNTSCDLVRILILVLVLQPVFPVDLSRKQEHVCREMANSLEIHGSLRFLVEKLGILAKLEIFLWANVKE